jgi:hypothetical protein
MPGKCLIPGRKRNKARGNYINCGFAKTGIKNPHVDLPLGMIWPKREDEDNSIVIR